MSADLARSYRVFLNALERGNCVERFAAWLAARIVRDRIPPPP